MRITKKEALVSTTESLKLKLCDNDVSSSMQCFHQFGSLLSEASLLFFIWTLYAQQENLLHFPLLLLKRRTPFIHRKWRILPISSYCRVNQKRNFGGIPFEESSAITPQVEYSFLPPKTDGSPHFLLL